MRKKFLRFWSLIIFSAYFVAGKALLACSTCSASYSEGKIDAYKISTLLLISLPFTITGLITFYVVKKLKARKLAEEKNS